MLRQYDAWVLARLASAQPCDDLVAELHPGLQPLAKYMAELSPPLRPFALGGYRAGQRDPEAFYKAIADADPLGPAPAADAVRPACALDLGQAAQAVQWAWPGWLPKGRVSGIGGFEGTGKTRFALDLARRAYHGLPWPDGQPMPLPAGSKSMWICGDGHQEEIADAARKMNIPLDAILFNAKPENPCDGVDLDDPDAIESLETFLEISSAPLVFIDTLSNSTGKDLCRQNDVKLLLSPLQAIAQRRQVVIAVLVHLSREGQALGRRTKGLTRTLLHLERPDPDTPGRLRLWVEKSFEIKPPALGVTMGEAGNEYDDSPPENDNDETSAARKSGRASSKLDACRDWLSDQLAEPVRVAHLRTAAHTAGHSTGTLYESAKRLEVVEYILDDRKWWKLPDEHVVEIF